MSTSRAQYNDIDRNVNKSSRLSFRSSLLDPASGDDFIYNAKHKELDALRILYSPLEAYHKFANMHSSADAIAVGILEGVPNFNDKGFRKEVQLGTLDNYVIMLHCLNSTLACDKYDVNDPIAITPEEHKLFLTKYAYNPDTPITTVNISMMHHPLAWFDNNKDMQEEFDHKFKVQIYGHVHTQSIQQDIEGKSPIRLQCGSLHPGNYGNPELYPPVYNILELNVTRGVLRLNVICFSWDGEKFMKDDRFCYTRKITLPEKRKRSSRQRREVSLTKSKEMNEKEMYEIRYHFFRSRHIKEIILAMNPKSYDENKPEYANASLLSILYCIFVNKSIEINVILQKRQCLILFKHCLSVKSHHTYTIVAYIGSLAIRRSMFSRPLAFARSPTATALIYFTSFSSIFPT
mgnify:CR=1 FL=1